MNELITSVNDAVWGYVLIIALVGCGLWFTWRTHFVQFRMIGEMLRVLTDSAVDTVEEHVREMGPQQRRISSFQAFAVSVATRVGTGNLAGVASAIAIGGPGAVFWMWMIALVGSATAFVCLTTTAVRSVRASRNPHSTAVNCPNSNPNSSAGNNYKLSYSQFHSFTVLFLRGTPFL